MSKSVSQLMWVISLHLSRSVIKNSINEIHQLIIEVRKIPKKTKLEFVLSHNKLNKFFKKS